MVGGRRGERKKGGFLWGDADVWRWWWVGLCYVEGGEEGDGGEGVGEEEEGGGGGDVVMGWEWLTVTPGAGWGVVLRGNKHVVTARSISCLRYQIGTWDGKWFFKSELGRPMALR